MNLIEDKITFHRRYLWSRRERFGEEADPAREQRIEELRQTKAQLSALLSDADGKGKVLEIACDIRISARRG